MNTLPDCTRMKVTRLSFKPGVGSFFSAKGRKIKYIFSLTIQLILFKN